MLPAVTCPFEGESVMFLLAVSLLPVIMVAGAADTGLFLYPEALLILAVALCRRLLCCDDVLEQRIGAFSIERRTLMNHQAERPIALVTGASGGIGSAIARHLAKAGYGVVMQYHTQAVPCQAVCGEILAEGGEAMCISCDLQSVEQIEKMFDCVERQWGSVSVLVNNAGIGRQQLFTDMTESQWQELWQVNVSGAIWCSKRALPAMVRAKSGNILNVSSIWGMVGGSCEVAYSVTKGALISFTKALAKEVGPSGIRVNCVAPGVIDTPMNSHLSREELTALAEETPLGVIGTPDDVAALVEFLLSPQGRFITGQVISPNGGFVI